MSRGSWWTTRSAGRPAPTWQASRPSRPPTPGGRTRAALLDVDADLVVALAAGHLRLELVDARLLGAVADHGVRRVALGLGDALVVWAPEEEVEGLHLPGLATADHPVALARLHVHRVVDAIIVADGAALPL